MKPVFLAKTLWRGILGIAVEVMLTAVFIGTGFFICLVWWKVLK